MCTRYPIINRVSELKVHIELTRFVQPEKIEIDANERAVNEKSPYCFFVCTTFDSFLNDFTISFLILILPYFSDSVHLLIPVGRKTLLFLAWEWRRSWSRIRFTPDRSIPVAIQCSMPGMDGDMWTLAQQTLSKLKRMTDSDYDSQKFYFTDENE